MDDDDEMYLIQTLQWVRVLCERWNIRRLDWWLRDFEESFRFIKRPLLQRNSRCTNHDHERDWYPISQQGGWRLWLRCWSRAGLMGARIWRCSHASAAADSDALWFSDPALHQPKVCRILISRVIPGQCIAAERLMSGNKLLEWVTTAPDALPSPRVLR